MNIIKNTILWKEHKNHLVGTYGLIKINKKSKVSAFDLDSTLIEPTGKKKFSTGSDDWKFYHQSVIHKLNNLHKNGYKIVIISNQLGISSGKTDKELWKKKVENVASKIDIPLLILVSFYNDCYRKPMTKLWDTYLNCNMKISSYCGDAAGLPKRKINNKVIPKDFNDSDYKFALNLGIHFTHRDEFIYCKKWTIKLKYIDFNDIKQEAYKNFKPNHTEMILNIGYPASGKSYYTKNYVLNHGYKYINMDTLKTANKCIKSCEKHIKNGKSVIIDNTNPSIDTRKKYIDIAKKYHIKCKALYFTTSYDLSMHNNHFRNWITNGETKKIPKIAYNIFKSKFQKPTKDEGFYEIKKINFKLDKNVDESYFKYF